MKKLVCVVAVVAGSTLVVVDPLAAEQKDPPPPPATGAWQGCAARPGLEISEANSCDQTPPSCQKTVYNYGQGGCNHSVYYGTDSCKQFNADAGHPVTQTSYSATSCTWSTCNYGSPVPGQDIGYGTWSVAMSLSCP